MKTRLTLLFVILLFVITLFGQKITKKEGFYMDENAKNYSGIYVSYYPNGNKEIGRAHV